MGSPAQDKKTHGLVHRKYRGFTTDELKKFLAVIVCPRDRMCFEAMAYLGLAISDAVRINTENIDFEGNKYAFRRYKTHKVEWRPMGEHIKDEFRGFLLHNFNRMRHNYLIYPKNSSTTAYFASESTMRNHFDRYRRMSGLDDYFAEIPHTDPKLRARGKTSKMYRLTTHSFKFWYAKYVRSVLKDPALVQAFTGHSSRKNVAIYDKPDWEEIQQATQKVWNGQTSLEDDLWTILKKRLVKGEITLDEYDAILQKLRP